MNKLPSNSKKKKIIIFIALVVFIISGFSVYAFFNKQATGDTTYILGTAEKGMLISTLSSTGQVYVSSQYDIKSKVSSTITDVFKKKGDKVSKGDIILRLDASDLTKQLRSAQISLENARNNYEKAIKPADSLSLAQAESSLQNAKDNLEKLKISQENALSQAQDSKNNAELSLKTSYDSALNTMDSAFSGTANIMNDLRTTLYLTNTLLPQDATGDITKDKNLIDMNNVWNVEIPKYWDDISNSTNFDLPSDKENFVNLAKKATAAYKNAKIIYDENIIFYRNLTKFSSQSEIESFLDKSISTMQSVVESLRNLNNLYSFYIDYNNQRQRTIYYNINTYNTTLKNDTTTATGYLSNLINAKTGNSGILTVKSNLVDISNTLSNLAKTQPMDLVASENSLKIQQESYNKLKKGPEELDIRSYKLSITSANASLADVQEQLSNYTIKAPIDGTIASLPVSVGDEVSNSTTLTTVVTKQNIAQLTFNEVDIAKIKVGQKVTLAFDAISDLSLTGEVIDIDSLGTVSQGIVSYTVKIGFDATDDRVKPGMSVTANIIIDSKSDVILVDNSAVKVSGGSNYVEIFEDNKDNSTTIVTSSIPTKKTVEIGSSNDTSTEIVSGLSDGDKIIIKKVLPTSTASATKSTGSTLIPTGGAASRGGMNYGR